MSKVELEDEVRGILVNATLQYGLTSVDGLSDVEAGAVVTARAIYVRTLHQGGVEEFARRKLQNAYDIVTAQAWANIPPGQRAGEDIGALRFAVRDCAPPAGRREL